MARKKHVPGPPDTNTIYVWIENPVGMGSGGDLRQEKSPHLYLLSQWLLFLGEKTGTKPAGYVWSKPKTTSVIVPFEVPGRDESKIQHILGHHDWDQLLIPRNSPPVRQIYPNQIDFAGFHSTFFVCKLQNNEDIAIEGTCAFSYEGPRK